MRSARIRSLFVSLLAPLMVALALLLAPLAAQAHPGNRMPSEAPPLHLPVVVHGAGGLVVRAEAGMEALAQQALSRAPGTLERLARSLEGLPRPASIDIRLVRDTGDLGGAAPPGRGAPEWARGVAYPDLGVTVVATRRAHESIDVLRVLDHELAHLALGAALGGRAPRWLDEGFAFLNASEMSPGRMQTLVGMAWSGDTASLAQLERMFHSGELTVDRAYAQSYDFVAFLARRGRYPDVHDDGDRWPFQQFLSHIAAGLEPGAAARAAYGVGLGTLLQEWRVDLQQRYMLVPASLFAAGVWVLAALLLVVGFVRRRRRNRNILARWDLEERGPRTEPVSEPVAAPVTAPRSAAPGAPARPSAARPPVVRIRDATPAPAWAHPPTVVYGPVVYEEGDDEGGDEDLPPHVN
ncbi:peptidase MA family metallohydrolase [Haliangium ochraceum]|uniref:Peptidase MA-like domain-containing protein n=1 Tax=Haliangium ochraceum (strain DSM 14365 / JCM 11303 / SMP-2) TaxID=502025 RepID=D0LTZ6_HALO1|nr:hypothetical protein [Haliangium ochraceum]ACY17360.1 hypothetical protein Hoch_4871 [Haliangium ochraceum DSM 14365]